jgi:hypothetical protein
MQIYGLKATVWMYGEPFEKYSANLFHTIDEALEHRAEFCQAVSDNHKTALDNPVTFEDCSIAAFNLKS